LGTSDTSWLHAREILILNISLLYYAFYIHIKLSFKTLYILKNIASNAVGKLQISKHTYGQTAEIDFLLYYVVIKILIVVLMAREIRE
jgi:hypothetical protein